MRHHGIRIWALVLLAVLLPLAAQAQFTYAYSFDFTRAFVMSYTGDGGDVVIPDTVSGPVGDASVVGLDPGLFMAETNLNSVTVPATVTNIGDYAFATNAILSEVYFLGDAPALGTGVFNATTTTVYYLTNTTGWGATYGGRPTAAYASAVLSVTPSYRAVGYEAGTTTFTVANTGGGTLTYTPTESEAWLAVSSSTSAALSITYAENTDLWARTGTVTVTASGAQNSPTNVTVVQAAKPVLTIDPSSTNFSCLVYAGRSFQVEGNQAWTAVSSDAWLTISSGASGTGAGTVTYAVAENSGAARSATITVSGGGITNTFTVNQEQYGPAIEVEPTAVAFAYAAADNQTIEVSANVSWTAVSSASWLVITAGSTGTDYADVTYRVEENQDDASRTGTITISGSGVTATVTVTQAAPPAKIAYDFDGDGKADIAVFHRPTRTMFVNGSTNGTMVRQWDREGLLPAPADYDGDGVTDWAVFDPETGQWQISGTPTGEVRQVAFGWWGSIPLPGDYDGDGEADLAVFNPLDARWSFIGSQAGRYTVDWGGQDMVPVPADYDGDGKTDVAVYEPYTGNWQILRSSNGRRRIHSWGWAFAVPVPADYDGDGKTDIAVFHRDDCAWYIAYSGGGSRLVRYPLRGTVPVPADYDGDGKTDLAVYHPHSGYWYVLYSSTGQIERTWWGASTAHAVQLLPTIHAWFNLP